ncbi:retrovirus-related pol polyprotein from transposon TNT 1-94, partial [Tanacetum coccineum]
SSTGVDNTAKTRRPQPRSNTKNDRVPSASKSSCSKNKEVEVEVHPRNLMFSKNKKHMSSECNNIKLAIRNNKSEVVCAMCKQCLITSNHDVCVHNYVNDMNSHVNKINANVSNTANKKKHKPKVLKPKKVGSKERLASPKPEKPRTCLRWSPTGRIFDLKGKIIESSKSESQSDCSNDSGCSKHMTGNLKLLINIVWKFLGTVRFGNDHVAAILGYSDLQFRGRFQKKHLFRQNLEGVDLLKGNRTTNLYTINLYEMASASPICLMAHATSTKYWLWHQRLSHLNFDTINDLAKNDLIIDDYSRYTRVHFLRSKDEASEEIKTFLKKITVLLQALVIMQIGVVERRNQTLVEVARTMLIFSRAPLFLWAEAIATACYTQNRSIIHRRFNKTSYELINGKKMDISFLHVFEALCYPKNDREDIGKLGAKGDIGFFIGYSATSCAYRVYNRRTKKLMETMNVIFDELSAMAFKQRSSKPGLQSMNSGQISSGLDLTYAP